MVHLVDVVEVVVVAITGMLVIMVVTMGDNVDGYVVGEWCWWSPPSACR